jgi:hypothetical protein
MRAHSVGKNLVPNTKTTMFTIPTKHLGAWALLYAYNGTASAKNFTAWWYDKSENVEIPVVYEYNLTAKSYLRLDGQAYVVLDEGDEIRVQIETGATIATCIVTLELEPKLAVQFN